MLHKRAVWVFCGNRSSFPSAVFVDLDIAEEWIGSYALSGMLTQYPLNESVYDWAINKRVFEPSSPQHLKPEFIERFSSAALEHYHYENGLRI